MRAASLPLWQMPGPPEGSDVHQVQVRLKAAIHQWAAQQIRWGARSLPPPQEWAPQRLRLPSPRLRRQAAQQVPASLQQPSAQGGLNHRAAPRSSARCCARGAVLELCQGFRHALAQTSQVKLSVVRLACL